MIGWRKLRCASSSSQALVDAAEARALAGWLASHANELALRRAVLEAARTAEALERLDRALKYAH